MVTIMIMIMTAKATLALDEFDSARLRKFSEVALEEWKEVRTRRESCVEVDGHYCEQQEYEAT